MQGVVRTLTDSEGPGLPRPSDEGDFSGEAHNPELKLKYLLTNPPLVSHLV
jgi:hypothetical protein